MSLDELLEKRRSIRKYMKTALEHSTIEMVVRSAMNTPSPSNSRPVRFILIQSKEKRHALLREMEKGKETFIERMQEKNIPRRFKNLIHLYYRYSVFMVDAPALFAVATLTRVDGFSTRMFDAGLISNNGAFFKDMSMTAGLSIQAFMLKAAELHLGTCILTAPCLFLEKVEKILDVTDDFTVQCFLTLGIPDEAPGPISRLPVTEGLTIL